MAQKVADIYALFGVRRDSSWGAADSALKGLERGAKYAAVAAAGALYGIKRLVEGATETATHLISYSAAMGMSVEKTQEWGYVAQQSGSNIKELSIGVNMFLRHLKDFSEGRGGKALADQMHRIGITATAAKKAVADPAGFNAALLHTSDALKGMNETQRATLTTLFGQRVGRAVIADMSRGSEAIVALQNHYRELGAELTGPQTTALRQLGNNFNDIKIALNGLVNQAIAEATPAINELTQGILDMVKDPEKRAAAIEALSGVIRGAAFVAKKLADAVLLLGRGINWMLEHKTAVEAMLAAIFAIYLPLKFLSVITKIRAMLGGIAAMRGAAGVLGGAAGAGVAGTAAAGLGAPAAAGAAGAFPAAAVGGAVVRNIVGAAMPIIGGLMIGVALARAIGEDSIFARAKRGMEKKELRDANRDRIAQQEAVNESNANINADYRSLYGHAAKVDPFALADAGGGGKNATANTKDQGTNFAVTNGPISITVNAPGANAEVGDAVRTELENQKSNEYRAMFDAAGGAGQGGAD